MNAALQYLRYVVRHKWWVFVAGLHTGAPVWRLLIHDWSKLTPAEFGPYARRFYGRKPIEIAELEWEHVYAQLVWDGVEISDATRSMLADAAERRTADITAARQAAFDRAWLHHLHANPHHWQHWLLHEDSGAVKALPMPEPLVREMVADWMGAGRAITGRWEVAEWFAKHRESMTLAPETAALVEHLILLHGDGMLTGRVA